MTDDTEKHEQDFASTQAEINGDKTTRDKIEQRANALMGWGKADLARVLAELEHRSDIKTAPFDPGVQAIPVPALEETPVAIPADPADRASMAPADPPVPVQHDMVRVSEPVEPEVAPSGTPAAAAAQDTAPLPEGIQTTPDGFTEAGAPDTAVGADQDIAGGKRGVQATHEGTDAS